MNTLKIELTARSDGNFAVWRQYSAENVQSKWICLGVYATHGEALHYHPDAKDAA